MTFPTTLTPDRPEPPGSGIRGLRGRDLQHRSAASRSRDWTAHARHPAAAHARQCRMRHGRGHRDCAHATICGCWKIRCDALGATFDGKLAGTFGDMASLSFYPGAPDDDGRRRRRRDQQPAPEEDRPLHPRLGPRLLVRSRENRTPAANASAGSWAICRPATTTSTSTPTWATT